MTSIHRELYAGPGVEEETTTKGPVVLRRSSEPVEMVDLFTIDEVTYQIPAKPNVNIALKYLRVLKRQGELVATSGLLEDLLGEEGFEALTNYEDLTEEDFEAVMTAAQKVTMGSLENTLGNSGSGPKK
jgi:hypothetical protein